MNRVVRMAAVSWAALAGVQALADPADHPLSPRHQVLACMTKKMSASRSISYNEAAKLCTAQVKAQNPSLASTGPPPRPVGGIGMALLAPQAAPRAP
jgi:hypothetical protein